VETFYRHRVDEVAFIPVFAAFVENAPVRLSHEHDAFDWLPFAAARERLAWPRERRALADIAVLLTEGNAGALEDVLRIAD
jgi:8-oxo-dGTP pyrophosphatase MutT (NUDIX family)